MINGSPKRTAICLDLTEVATLLVEHVNCIINNDNAADGHCPFRIPMSAHILRYVSKYPGSKDPVCVQCTSLSNGWSMQLENLPSGKWELPKIRVAKWKLVFW